MKRFRHPCSILAILSIVPFLFSCSGIPEHAKMIPANSAMVMNTDPKTLLSKANPGELMKGEGGGSMKDVMKETVEANKGFKKLQKKLMNNPWEIGIDGTDELFLFYNDALHEEPFYGMTAATWSASDIRDNVRTVADGMDMALTIEEKKGYEYITIGQTMLMAWNEDHVLGLFSEGSSRDQPLTDALGAWIEDLEEKGVTANKNFRTFYDKGKDMNLWVASQNMQAYQSLLRFFQTPEESDIEVDRGYLHTHLAFRPGKVALEVRLFNKSMDALMEKNQIFRDLNKKTLEYLPERNFLTSVLAVDPKGLFQMTEENMPKEIEDMRKMSKQFLGTEMEKIVTALGGDMGLSITDLKQYKVEKTTYKREFNEKTGSYTRKEITRTENKTFPVFSLVASLEDPTLIENKLGKLQKMGLVNKKKGYYDISSTDRPIFITTNADHLLIFSDRSKMKAFKKGGYGEKSLKGSPLASDLKNTPFMATVDIDPERYSETMREQMGTWTSMVTSLSDVYERFTIQSIDRGIACSVQLKEQDKNSLHVILKDVMGTMQSEGPPI